MDLTHTVSFGICSTANALDTQGGKRIAVLYCTPRAQIN